MNPYAKLDGDLVCTRMVLERGPTEFKAEIRRGWLSRPSERMGRAVVTSTRTRAVAVGQKKKTDRRAGAAYHELRRRARWRTAAVREGHYGSAPRRQPTPRPNRSKALVAWVFTQTRPHPPPPTQRGGRGGRVGQSSVARGSTHMCACHDEGPYPPVRDMIRLDDDHARRLRAPLLRLTRRMREPLQRE